MKNILTLLLSLLIIISASAQAKKVAKPAATSNKAILISNPGLVKFSNLTKKQLIPFRLNGAGFQRISSSSTGNTTIGRSRTPDREQRSNERSEVSQGQYCTYATVSEANGEYEKIVLGNQNDKIYPGAIYTDNAILDGSYNAPATLRLRPYQITSNLFSASSSGSSYVEVQPSMGDVYNGVAELMGRSRSVINPSAISIEVEEMYSAEQLAFFLQAGFQGYGVDLSAEFDYTKRQKKHVIFAKLKQVYFSVNVNRPIGANLIENALNTVPNNLVYVNKVNYGRIGIIKLESDSSVESISAALEFTYSSGNTGASATARASYQRTLANSKVSGFFFGGDASNIVPISSSAGLSQFNEYVRNGLRLDPNVAPTAVSYELKYVTDNATAAVNSTTSYQERNCVTAKGVKITLNGISIEDIHGGDCSYAWGAIDLEIWELNERGAKVKRVNAVNNEFEETTATRMWNYPNSRSPQRGMLNYASIRNNQSVDLNNINRSWNFLLDPTRGLESYAVIVKANINTNHKDNDFAALGEHGMRRTETRSYKLNEVYMNPQDIATKAKYGTMIVGPFSSYSGSDRQHQFRAHFTVTAAN